MSAYSKAGICHPLWNWAATESLTKVLTKVPRFPGERTWQSKFTFVEVKRLQRLGVAESRYRVLQVVELEVCTKVYNDGKCRRVVAVQMRKL